jgi:hypothetical protein
MSEKITAAGIRRAIVVGAKHYDDAPLQCPAVQKRIIKP